MKTPAASSDIASAAAQTVQSAGQAAHQATQQATQQAINQAGSAENRASASAAAALDQWAQLSKAQLGFTLSIAQSLLKGTRALRQVQLEAGERAQERFTEAQSRLGAARDINELISVQSQLLRSNAESALQYWTQCFDALQRSRVEAAGSAASALSDLQKATQQLASRGAATSTAAAQGTGEDLSRAWGAAGMLGWPSEDAARSAMNWATSAWDQWLTQASQWQRSAGQAAGSQSSMH
ncbi:phasin family protein [Aquabacterium sp. A7-Y]|uniref:phasin family protein n=1 Tax=Aquabacterium sp. A7-Y TaxID=1349605 RepID=UPI00223E5080|nr:phasin family protein [Aquabacterium sp. A7-Y]MCW7539211.1 phasin family protein [Aquabacterium sp. A7-Y]